MGLFTEREEPTNNIGKILKGIATNVVCAVGGMALVLGEIDDAPGLGGIGLIAIVGSMYYNAKLLYKIKQ